MANSKPYYALIIDDEADILQITADWCHEAKLETLTASNAAEAQKILAAQADQIVLVISDFKMPGMTGMELRAEMLKNKEQAKIPFVLISGFISKEDALSGIDHKISGFLEKPADLEKFKSQILPQAKPRIEELELEAELLKGFVSDAETLIEELEALLLSLEQDPGNLDTINRIYAIAHTIKGSSGFFKPDTITRFTHRFEDYLKEFKNQHIPIPPHAQAVLLKGCDTLKTLVALLKTEKPIFPELATLVTIFEAKAECVATTTDPCAIAGPTATAAGGVSPLKKTTSREEVKVSLALLDHFTELSGEITVIRNMVNKLVRSIEKELGARAQVSQLVELLDEMYKINVQMQDNIVEIRKVSFKNICRPLQRVSRDLSIALQKEVQFETKGEDIRVDSRLGEVLSNSLIHLIRNCMDHGLEMPAVRVSQKKPAKGSLKVLAEEKGETIRVLVSDDGKGIDPEIIRKKIVEKGLFSLADAAKMNDTQLRDMIFESGFSTAAATTDVSGRGVGMDMVKKSVEGIGGQVKIHSQVGKGTVFDISLPLPKSVLIIPSVLVEVGGENFAIPQEATARLLSIERENLKQWTRETQGAQFLMLDHELVPILDLARYLGLASTSTQRPYVQFIIAKTPTGHFAIQVDKIIDMEDTVVKKLSGAFKNLECYLGGTFLGDGRVALILNHETLAKACRHKEMPAQKTDETLDKILSQNKTRDTLIVDCGTDHRIAIPLEQVFRLENLEPAKIQMSGEQPVIRYRDTIIPIFELGQKLNLKAPPILGSSRETYPALIVRAGKSGDRWIALLVHEILDLMNVELNIDTAVNSGPLVQGSALIKIKDREHIHMVLDLTPLSRSLEEITRQVIEAAA